MTERQQRLADAQLEETIDNMLYMQGQEDYASGVWYALEDMAYQQGAAKAEDEARFPTKPTTEEELPT